MGVVDILFFMLASFGPARPFMFIFVSLSLLLPLIAIWMLRSFLMQQMKELNQKIAAIDVNHLASAHLNIAENSELISVATYINNMLTRLRVNQANTQQQTETQLQELQKKTTETKNAPAEEKNAFVMLSHYDALTGLPNRIFFNETLNKALNHAKRHKKILAILLVNLDAFKSINTTFNTTVGDTALREIATRLGNTLRAEDVLAKLDNDEFIVLLTDVSKAKFASIVAEKLLQACAKPLKIDSHVLSLTASIGICIYPDDGTNAEKLFENAAAALHKIKNMGGGAYQFYTDSMHAEAHEYLQLGMALKKAVQNKELTLYYQPKLHVKKGLIIGVEALIRWTHPELGIISPAKFIPIAEETGLIMQLGEWTLREACEMNKFWQAERYEYVTIAVNLSAQEFHHPEIANIIAKVLQETELDPNYLELEINEAIIMDDIEEATAILNKIKQTGVHISIDHFGIGHTAISHLKQLPINIIKIDPTFIKGLPNNPNDTAITNAFIALAHNLGVETIAEGVETAEQVQYLSQQQCDMVQGYFLSHPLPAEQIVLQFKKLTDRVLIQ